jgi:NADPH2:quinone reductase
MKAIRVHRFGGPEVLTLEDVPVPDPAPNQVLVRLQAIGVNPVDTYVRSGTNPKLSLPYTPGIDGAGLVEKAGENVSHVKAGDRVYIGGSVSGVYAEFALSIAEDVHRLPTNVTLEQGAGVNIPYATAWRALFQKAHAKPGETVLVHGGSGGVGLASIQIARAAGLTVIASAGTEAGRQLALDQGSHHVLDHCAPDYLKEVLPLTGGCGLDIILEMLANINLGQDLPMLAPAGRVVVIGSRGKVEITPRDAMFRDTSIHAMLLFNATRPELAAIHAALHAGLENGTLRPVIGREFPLASASQAHEAVMAPGAHGKIILRP